MAQNTQGVAGPAPVRLSLGYKFIWGIAALGSSLISGIYAALLPIFYQDYLGARALIEKYAVQSPSLQTLRTKLTHLPVDIYPVFEIEAKFAGQNLK